MAKLKSFDAVREKWLRDYEVKKEYDALSTEFQIAAEIVKARTKAKMSQADLAERIGTNPRQYRGLNRHTMERCQFLR